MTSNIGLISLGIGLVAGNFIARAITGQDYSVAIDRSFFQIVALLAVRLL